MSINVIHCYLDEFSPKGKFIAEDYKNEHLWKNRRIGVNPYIDPDSASRKLYEDLKFIYSKPLPNGEMLEIGEIIHTGYYQLKNENNRMRLSSDFIGPSATGAFDLGIPSLEVGKSLLQSRTIGGHTLWPCHRSSINQAKASVNDRMDITLLELKDFYKNPKSRKALYSARLRNAFVRDINWLMQFEDFKGYCDFFFFVDSFVDSNYNVVMFADVCENSKFRPKNYLSFMNNNCKAICLRNAEISKYIQTI